MLNTGTTYQLYYSIRSPFGRRIRVALQRLLMPFESHEVNSFELTPEFLAMAPLGLSPVLKLTRGKEVIVLPDSATILEYLHESCGNKVWPQDLDARLKVRAASTVAEGIMTNTVNLVLEKMRTHPEARDEYSTNIRRALQWCEQNTPAQMPWKVSDFQLTQAGYDLTIALEYLEVRCPELNWKADFANLSRFLDVHRKRQDLAPTAPPAV